MPQSDIEVLQLNLFQAVGLTHISQQEMVEVGTMLEENCGVAAILIAYQRLSPSDAMAFEKLLEKSDDENAFHSFLAQKGLNLQEMALKEVIRIKRNIIESDMQFTSVEKLREAVTVLLPWRVNHGLDPEWDVADAAQSRLDAFFSKSFPQQPVKLETRIKMRETINKHVTWALAMLAEKDRTGQLEKLIKEASLQEIERQLAANGISLAEITAEVIDDDITMMRQGKR